jgi:hypothetical protein
VSIIILIVGIVMLVRDKDRGIIATRVNIIPSRENNDIKKWRR